MKWKILTISITAMMFAGSASSQTIKENIDKAHADKDARNKSAKADVIIMPKLIYDSTANNPAASKTKLKKTSAGNKKIKYKKHKR